MRHIYIYYRIDPAQAEVTAQVIDTLLSHLTPYCAATPRRLVRCDEPDMWMELYEGITELAAFEARLHQLEQTLIPGNILLGIRHRECFAAPG